MGNTRDDIVSLAVRSAAPWLKQCPEICVGGISSLLLGGYTSESGAIYVQCQCPACVQQPGDGLQNLEEHVQHVTGDEVPPGNGNSICRNFLFFHYGNSQVSFKAYMKQVGEQYHGKELTGTPLWLFRFDTATTAAAKAEPGTGVWVQAAVLGYNDKTGEHEIQFADGSALAGKRSKIFVGASHVHFGDAAPTAGAAPNRVPPAGLAFEMPAHAAASKQQSAAATDAAATAATTEAEVKAPAAEGVPAAAPGKTGTRSPSKRQAALAAPAQWAAAGVLAPGAKRAASAAAAAVGAANGVAQGKKARVSNSGSADAAAAAVMNGGAMAANPFGVIGYPGPRGPGNLTQQQLMMFAAHTQQMMAANATGYGEAAAAPSRARRSANPSFAAAAPAAAVDQGIKTSRFRGVSWNKRTLKWQVTLYARGRYRYFGSYTDQEEAARAYDRAALVWKGPNAQLNYPASTYLKGNQKAQLQQLQEQAQQEAAKGNEPPPELPPGEAGTAALEAVAAQQEAAAAAAAAAAGGSRGVSPAVCKAGSKRRVSSGGGGGGQDQADKAAAAADTASVKRGVVIKDEAGADQAADADVDTAAAADEDDDVGEGGLPDDHSMEEDEGTGGEDDQAAGNLGHSNAAGAVAGDVAGTLAGPVIYKKRRKRKAQGKLFTRKKIHKQDIQLQMPIYAASSLRPPPEVMRMLAAAGASKATPGSKGAAKKALDLGDQPSEQAPAAPPAPFLTKEEQVVAAATAAAAAAAAAGRAVGAAKRKPGRGTAAKPPQAQLQQPPQQQHDQELLPQSRSAAKVKAESGRSEHSGMKVEDGTEDPDAVDGAAAGRGSSPGTGSGSDGEGDEGTGAEDGDGAEGIGMRRSQRQAAKKAQKKTARRMASVVNARSDGLWARLMQRAGSDAESSEEDGGGSRNEAGVEQGDLEAMAAAAQAAGVSRDVVMNAHEQAKKLLESGVAMSGVSAAARGRGRGRGRGRRGIGKRGRPPGSGIAARMAELHAQFVALGGTYGNDDKTAQVKREIEPGAASKPSVAGLAATRERRVRRTPPAAHPPLQQQQQDMEVDREQDGAHGNSSQNAEGGASELGDADAASPSETAAAEAAAALAAGDEADEAEDDDEEMDAEAAAAAAAAEEDLQEDDEQQQHGDGSAADHDDADGVDDDDADVAALLLGLTGGPAAAAAVVDDDDDEGVMPGMDYPHHAPHQHPGYGEDEHYADDQRSVDMDSWGAGAPGAASRRLGGYGGRSQRERASNSKYGEEEWAPPKSLRNRGRGRGRGRARGSAASLAATAAASSSGQPYYHPAAGGKGGRGAGAPKVQGRTFVYAPKYGGGGRQQHGMQQPYWPPMGAMAGKTNMPPWMMHGMGPMMPGMMPSFNPAAMAAAAAAAFMPPGMWPGLPGQQKQKQQKRTADKEGSGSEGELSEGEDQLQQQAEEAAGAAANAAAAFNRMPPPQMAQHFVQVMFMAVTTGQPQYVMEFQTLYACLCSNPTAWGHVMSLLFQFGTQMGANIAAAGGVAPAMAAAFNSMAEQGQGGNTGTAAAAEPGNGGAKTATPAKQPASKAKGGGATDEGCDPAAEGNPEAAAAAAAAAAAGGGGGGDSTAEPAAAAAATQNSNANTLPGSEKQATAGKQAAHTAALDPAAANAAPCVITDGAAMPPAEPATGDSSLAAADAATATPPLPVGGTLAATSGSQSAGRSAAATLQATPAMPGPYNPAAAAAAAAACMAPDQYMRVMMGLPIEESEDEESVQEDEDEEVARLAAGAGAKSCSSPTPAIAAATPVSAAAPMQVASDTTAAAAAAAAPDGTAAAEAPAAGRELHLVGGNLLAAAAAQPAAITAAGDVAMEDAPAELPAAAIPSQLAVQAVQPAVRTPTAELPAAEAVQAVQVVHAPGQVVAAELPAGMTSQVSPQLGMPAATAVTGSMPGASLVTPHPASSQVSPQLHAAGIAGVTSIAGMPSASLVTTHLQSQVSPQQPAMHSTAQAAVQQGTAHMQPPVQQLVTPQVSMHTPPAAVPGMTPNAVFQQHTSAIAGGPGSMPTQQQQQQQHPMPMMQQYHVLQPQMAPQQQYVMAGQFMQPPQQQQQQQQQLGMQQVQAMHMQRPIQPQLQQQQQQQQPGMVQMGWQPQQSQGFQGAHMQQLVQQQQQQQQGPSAVACRGFAGAMPVYVLNIPPQAGLQHMQPVPSLAQQQQQQQQQHIQQQLPIMSQQMPQGGMAPMQPMASPASTHNASVNLAGSQLGMHPAAQHMNPAGLYKQEGLQ